MSTATVLSASTLSTSDQAAAVALSRRAWGMGLTLSAAVFISVCSLVIGLATVGGAL